jgi:hypothetical protein
MVEPKKVNKRRLGPIGFHGEAKVTSLRDAPASNEGGMGEASGPFLETPLRSKELKVVGPLVLGISGFLIFLAGLIFSLFIAAIGLGMIVYAILTNRRNKTQLRLRTKFKNS